MSKWPAFDRRRLAKIKNFAGPEGPMGVLENPSYPSLIYDQSMIRIDFSLSSNENL